MVAVACLSADGLVFTQTNLPLCKVLTCGAYMVYIHTRFGWPSCQGRLWQCWFLPCTWLHWRSATAGACKMLCRGLWICAASNMLPTSMNHVLTSGGPIKRHVLRLLRAGPAANSWPRRVTAGFHQYFEHFFVSSGFGRRQCEPSYVEERFKRHIPQTPTLSWYVTVSPPIRQNIMNHQSSIVANVLQSSSALLIIKHHHPSSIGNNHQLSSSVTHGHHQLSPVIIDRHPITNIHQSSCPHPFFTTHSISNHHQHTINHHETSSVILNHH